MQIFARALWLLSHGYLASWWDFLCNLRVLCVRCSSGIRNTIPLIHIEVEFIENENIECRQRKRYNDHLYTHLFIISLKAMHTIAAGSQVQTSIRYISLESFVVNGNNNSRRLCKWELCACVCENGIFSLGRPLFSASQTHLFIIVTD